MKEKTYEGTKKTQNGLKRMFFSVLAILLQAVFMVYMFTRLNEYAAAINTTTSVLAIILVLGLYNREQTASMTTPWITDTGISDNGSVTLPVSRTKRRTE